MHYGRFSQTTALNVFVNLSTKHIGFGDARPDTGSAMAFVGTTFPAPVKFFLHPYRYEFECRKQFTNRSHSTAEMELYTPEAENFLYVWPYS